MARGALAATLLLSAPVGTTAGLQEQHLVSETEANANPIRKVVTLLQQMQAKITAEGKKEEELYDKFVCYCTKNKGELTGSIEAATGKIASLQSELKASGEKKTQTEQDLKEHTASRDEAKATMEQSTALREKEAAAYAKVKADFDANLAALTKAIAAVEKGAAGGFLQTPAAQRVRSFAMESANLPDQTREELLSFLSGGQSTGYVPQSGEVTGILKELKDDMARGEADATAEEQNQIQTYEAMMTAKRKEVASLQMQIEAEMTRIGNLGVSIAGMSADLEDTQAALSADQKFQQELAKSCGTKADEWEEIKKTRAEELLAIADTIKVLNDDDALELFKKTLPSASMSFVQFKSLGQMQSKALSIVNLARHKVASSKLAASRPELDLISLALKGKKVNFDKVITMIDEMVANLKKEQDEDDRKREYCNEQLDSAEDKKKGLGLTIKDAETAMEEMTGSIAELKDEIAALEAGIKALDKSVSESTELRQKENAEYKDLMASNTQAKEVLGWAKNRLNKFYNPKLYKAPPKREMSEEERITVNMGGTLAPVEAGGIAGTGIGASFVQVSQHGGNSQHREAPPPPPETFGAYKTKGQQGGGVVAMIDLLVKDLEKEMTEADVNEKDAQAEYETMMGESADKRAADAKAITEKTTEKAATEEELQTQKENHASAGKELMATMKYLQNLHAECDWLLQYHEVRKTARAGEIEALGNAKAVLNGANYAFLQQGVKAPSSSFLASARRN